MSINGLGFAYLVLGLLFVFVGMVWGMSEMVSKNPRTHWIIASATAVTGGLFMVVMSILSAMPGR